MNKIDCIRSFTKLGQILSHVATENEWPGHEIGLTELEYKELINTINKQFQLNPWFVKDHVLQSINEWSNALTEERLIAFTFDSAFSDQPKNIAIIMAGNIPLVGFHDFLSVLLTGNNAVCKLSSDDKTLLPAISTVLCTINPEFNDRITFPAGPLKDIDAVIATGSDNSVMYFQQYFGKYPHIFRKNRTSVAILNGEESDEELQLLGKDMFDYFGRGCRNVSHLLVPNKYDINKVIGNLTDFGSIINHHKYANNYDYNRAIYLLNKIEFLDNNFALFRQSDTLNSPLSVIHYHFYNNDEEVNLYLKNHKDEIQAIIGSEYIPFGQAQCPKLDDFADNINTLKFLNALNA